MLRATLAALILTIAISTGFLPGDVALGNVQAPMAVVFGPEAPVAPFLEEAKAGPAATPKNRQVSSYAQLQQEILAKLRPVEREQPIDFDEAKTFLNSRTTNEKIFNKSFAGKMQGEYAGRVSPFEKTATDPLWRARSWEMQRYEDGRQDLARWTTREVMEDQLKEFFNGGDKDSTAMKALAAARSLSGGEEEKAAEPALTPEQKIARTHRTDLAQPTAVEEEKIPTRLKTKLNVLRQNGSVVFTNPVAITSVDGNKDEISMNMHRDFRKLTLHSNLAYGVKQECLNLNVNKKITDRVSLDLDHYNYTGDKRGSAGEKTKEQARVNYSMSF